MSHTRWLSTLNALAPEDRAWILQRLPAIAREKLLGTQLKSAPASAAQNLHKTTASAPAAALLDASGAAMAHLLSTEPTWFLVALLRANEWIWQEDFLAHLPTPVRLEVERGLAVIAPMTPALLDAVVAAAHARTTLPPPQVSTPPFESLLDRIAAARSRRRWSLAR
jgi:hypothetical protein